MRASLLVPVLALLAAPLAPAALAAQAEHAGGSVTPAYRSSPAPDAIEVETIVDGGGAVVLADGTRWEVRLQFRPTASSWVEGDEIVVRTIPAPTGDYEFLLVNATDGSKAEARFAGAGATAGSR